MSSVTNKARRFLRPGIIPAIIVMLQGCNPDVFVKELEASPGTMSIGYEGGTLKTRFNSGEWKIANALINGTFAEATTWIEGDRPSSGFPKPGDKVDSIKIHRQGETICTIYRRGSRNLEIKVEENVPTTPRTITLHVADDIFSKSITISQSAGHGWTLDGIVWADTLTYTSDILEPKGGEMTVVNHGNEDIVMNFKIFDGCTREVTFKEDGTDDYSFSVRSDITGNAEIPDGMLADGSLSFSGTNIPYGNMTRNIEIPLPDTEAAVHFPPGQHTCKIILEYEVYKVRFIAHLRTASGRIMERKGMFSSKTPTGWYMTRTE